MNSAETKNKGDIGDFSILGMVSYTFRRSLENKAKKGLVARIRLRIFYHRARNGETVSAKINLSRLKKLHEVQEAA